MKRRLLYVAALVFLAAAGLWAALLPDGRRQSVPGFRYQPDPRIPLRLLIVTIGLSLALLAGRLAYAKRVGPSNRLIEAMFWLGGIGAVGLAVTSGIWALNSNLRNP